MVRYQKFNPEKHHRRSIRLKNWDYSSPGIYFVTMRVVANSVHFGRKIDGKYLLNDLGKIVADSWMDIPYHYENIELDDWIVMPDHFHGIIIILDKVPGKSAIPESFPKKACKSDFLEYRNIRRKMLLPKIIGRFKMVSAKQINLKLHSSGKIWQRDYFEHIVRDKNSLTRIGNYIKRNPDKLKDW